MLIKMRNLIDNNKIREKERLKFQRAYLLLNK
jgi:hypothetical protein